MNTLHLHLPTQATPRCRELAQSLLVESGLTAEAKSQLVTDLSAVPEAWLERLKQADLDVVVMSSEQTLADTGMLLAYQPEELEAGVDKARPLIQQAIHQAAPDLDSADPGDAAYQRHWAAKEMAENLAGELVGAGLGFLVRQTSDPISLQFLAEEAGVEGDEQQRFEQLTRELNQDLVQFDGQQIEPEWGIVLVPYHQRHGQRVSPVNKASLETQKGFELFASKGAHIWENKLIMLHDSVVADPSLTAGHHRVALHELGHAIDHLAEELYPDHRQKMDALYQDDLKNANFLTARAADNAGEYLAEAVEAYLTNPGEGYKAENHHEALKAHNPRLFAYVDDLLRR
ncbi:MAG: hypothetical protein KC910_22025 [Candidatus Eremiobacteraeota bacterium]|nr:hypothetical protein [Candidatus Eremiobacteraeota bacterium]